MRVLFCDERKTSSAVPGASVKTGHEVRVAPVLLAASFVLALLAHAPAAARSRLVLPDGTLLVGQSGAATTVTISRRGSKMTGRLPADAPPEISPGTFSEAELIGTVGPDVAVLTTTYSSQTGIGGPDVQCAAGQEIVLRVVVLAPKPHQTFRKVVESCWDDVYQMPVTWSARDATARLGDGSNEPDPSLPAIVIGGDGHVHETALHP